MRSVGLITEYNPFHNGHLHHLQESRRLADAEVTVAVMSGHFLQRGEPALVDKWLRTKMALAAGVDLVLELPFPWACNSAPHFAHGAVQALNALGCIDCLCFGSESGSLDDLQLQAALLQEREPELHGRTTELLRQGVNFPTARAKAVAELHGDSDSLQTPNNILGIAYLRALLRTGSNMTPLTIPRRDAGYNDLQPGSSNIASATAVRGLVNRGESYAPYVPVGTAELLGPALTAGQSADFDLYHRLLAARILRGADSLKSLYLVENGLENRLYEQALTSSGWEELVTASKGKQLTRTRVQRALAHVCNEMEQEDMADFLERGPLYLHVLGYRPAGRKLLAQARKSCEIPLVGNYSRVISILKRRYGVESPLFRCAERQLQAELRATRNYTLLLPGWTGGNHNQDFFEDVIWEEGKR